MVLFAIVGLPMAAVGQAPHVESTEGAVHAHRQGGGAAALGAAVGYFDVGGPKPALQVEVALRSAHTLGPMGWWAQAGATTDGSVAAFGGPYVDIPLTPEFNLVLSTGAGAYRAADGKKLGFPLEFRSTIGLDYALDSGHIIGVGLGHISNAGLGRRNPGVNVLGLTYRFPLGASGSP